ncbi:MAG: prepilin-type N-terminal cleavage/methylation domain-containing protein [Planctomycetota bacterium]
MRRSHPLSRYAGFTLIELLVVISIIGLLISILLPALGAARHTARLTQDLTHLRQIATANAAYQVDFEGRFPLILNGPGNANGSDISELLIPYLQGVAYGEEQAWNTQYIYDNNVDMTMWESPLDSQELAWDGQQRSYGINRAPTASQLENNMGADGVGLNWHTQNRTGLSTDQAVDANRAPTNSEGFSLRIGDLAEASNTIAYAPQFRARFFCGWDNGSTVAPFEINGARGYNWPVIGGGWAAGDLNVLYGYEQGSAAGEDPNDYRVNFAFADGHGKMMKFQDTLNPNFTNTSRGDGRSLWNAYK